MRIDPNSFYANDEVPALTDIGSSSFGSSQFVNSRSSRRGGGPSEESGESSSGDPVGKYWKKRESPTLEEQRRRRKAPSPTIDPFHELSSTKSLKEHRQRYAGLLKKQQLLQIITHSSKSVMTCMTPRAIRRCNRPRVLRCMIHRHAAFRLLFLRNIRFKTQWVNRLFTRTSADRQSYAMGRPLLRILRCT